MLPIFTRPSSLAIVIAFTLGPLGTAAFAQNELETSTPVVTTLTDAQILAVLQTANKGEVEAGQLASKKANGGDIKKYAQDMVKQHQAATKDTDKLAQSLKVKPRDFATSEELKTTAKLTKETLSKMHGGEFDSAYINSQIAMHQEVLKTIDTQLLPSTKTASVKALIEKMRPTIETHLHHAEELKAKM